MCNRLRKAFSSLFLIIPKIKMNVNKNIQVHTFFILFSWAHMPVILLVNQVSNFNLDSNEVYLGMDKAINTKSVHVHLYIIQPQT